MSICYHKNQREIKDCLLCQEAIINIQGWIKNIVSPTKCCVDRTHHEPCNPDQPCKVCVDREESLSTKE